MTDDNIVDIYCDVVVNQMFQEIRYLQKLRPIMLSKVHRVNQSCSKIIEDKLYHKLSSNILKLPLLVENLVYLKWTTDKPFIK